MFTHDLQKKTHHITNGKTHGNPDTWEKHEGRLCHTYLCCLENMNKNITVSPNIPKIIIRNHGNRKSETQENNISLTGLPSAAADMALSFFHINILPNLYSLVVSDFADNL